MSERERFEAWALAQPRPTEKEAKATELANRYHTETEAYDRTVCTGPIRDDSIMPADYRQLTLVNINAHKVRRRIMEEAARLGISEPEMWRAISRHGA